MVTREKTLTPAVRNGRPARWSIPRAPSDRRALVSVAGTEAPTTEAPVTGAGAAARAVGAVVSPAAPRTAPAKEAARTVRRVTAGTVPEAGPPGVEVMPEVSTSRGPRRIGGPGDVRITERMHGLLRPGSPLRRTGGHRAAQR